MELSKRLRAIADMVTPGLAVADVGCDHGFVSVYLYENKIAPRVIAMDLRPGPLARAKEHIARFGYSAYIDTRLSDGVTALSQGEVEAVVCAGMGGRLMAKILEEGYDKIVVMKELILQPQSELQFFREFLREKHLDIVQENMIKEDGKYYPVIKAVPDREAVYLQHASDSLKEEYKQRAEDCFGPLLLENRHPVLKEFLEVMKQRNQKIMEGITSNDGRSHERIESLKEEIKDIVYCLSLYEEG